ncbi:MAG: sulfatase-like hydrolase/transferase [Kiritimatiellaeota bacterium]|nr:sulfatase-like hydrolase/transferase [Kiritimatiellota bacterium]
MVKLTILDYAGCFGYAGHPDVKTPNTDKLANNGVNFRNAFCPNGLCVPPRTSLLTGQYPVTHSVYPITNCYRENSLKSGQLFVPALTFLSIGVI